MADQKNTLLPEIRISEAHQNLITNMSYVTTERHSKIDCEHVQKESDYDATYVQYLKTLLEHEMGTHRALLSRQRELLNRLFSQHCHGDYKRKNVEVKEDGFSTEIFNRVETNVQGPTPQYIVSKQIDNHGGTRRIVNLCQRFGELRSAYGILLDNVISYGWSCNFDGTMTLVRLLRRQYSILEGLEKEPCWQFHSLQRARHVKMSWEEEIFQQKRLMTNVNTIKQNILSAINDDAINRISRVNSCFENRVDFQDLSSSYQSLQVLEKQLTENGIVLQDAVRYQTQIRFTLRRLTPHLNKHSYLEQAKNVIAKFSSVLDALTNETNIFCQNRVLSKCHWINLMMKHLEINPGTFSSFESHILRAWKYSQFLRSDAVRSLGSLCNSISSQQKQHALVLKEIDERKKLLKDDMCPYSELGEKVDLDDYTDSSFSTLSAKRNFCFEQLNSSWDTVSQVFKQRRYRTEFFIVDIQELTDPVAKSTATIPPKFPPPQGISDWCSSRENCTSPLDTAADQDVFVEQKEYTAPPRATEANSIPNHPIEKNAQVVADHVPKIDHNNSSKGNNPFWSMNYGDSIFPIDKASAFDNTAEKTTSATAHRFQPEKNNLSDPFFLEDTAYAAEQDVMVEKEESAKHSGISVATLESEPLLGGTSTNEDSNPFLSMNKNESESLTFQQHEQNIFHTIEEKNGDALLKLHSKFRTTSLPHDHDFSSQLEDGPAGSQEISLKPGLTENTTGCDQPMRQCAQASHGDSPVPAETSTDADSNPFWSMICGNSECSIFKNV